MGRRLLLALSAAVTASCHSAKTAPIVPDQKLVLGDWNLAQFKGDPRAFGRLHLNEDSTFEQEAGERSSSKTAKDGEDSKMTGRYLLVRETIADRSMLFVDFQVQKMNGKDVSPDHAFRLAYDPNKKLLYDLLTIAYCRPGDEPKVRQMLERQHAARR